MDPNETTAAEPAPPPALAVEPVAVETDFNVTSKITATVEALPMPPITEPAAEPAGELFRVVSRERVEKGVRITAATCDEDLGYEISLVLPDNEETRKAFDTGCSFYVDITPKA